MKTVKVDGDKWWGRNY